MSMKSSKRSVPSHHSTTTFSSIDMGHKSSRSIKQSGRTRSCSTSSNRSNWWCKKRLYIGIYSSDDEDFHWAFQIVDKDPSSHACTLLQVTDPFAPAIGRRSLPTWELTRTEEQEVLSPTFIARILIGKITRPAEIEDSLRRVPVFQHAPRFSSRTWVRDALARLHADGLLSRSSMRDWEAVESMCRDFGGEWQAWKRNGNVLALRPVADGFARPIPTYDMLRDLDVTLRKCGEIETLPDKDPENVWAV